MNRKHMLSFLVIGFTSFISMILFIGLVSNSDIYLKVCSLFFLADTWCGIQSIWWRGGELSADRIDQDGRYVDRKAKRWMDFLHYTHLWLFFFGFISCVGVVIWRSM